ncbi:TD and POZ domain-containing protein 3-like [Parasteatoda tepidariorum]|uniref:TD and POZ domain-containing protein 3-like n=1 Tax=Parasteatoda tepidariorum TaxID=114398 RepID=UPI0039BD420E
MSNEDGKKFSFIWSIENFSHSYLENGQKFISPEFVAENTGGSKWCVEIYPKGFNQENGKFISCFLKRNDDDLFPEFSEEIAVDFTFNVIGGNGEILGSFEEKNKIFKKGDSSGCLKLVQVEDKIKNSHEDILTIRCSLISYKPIATEYVARSSIPTLSCSFAWNVTTNSGYTSSNSFNVGRRQFEITAICNDSGVLLRVQARNPDPYLLISDIILLDTNGSAKFQKRDVHLLQGKYISEEWQFPFLTKEQLNETKNIMNRRKELELACTFFTSSSVGFNEIVKCKSNPSSSLSFPSLQKDMRALLLDEKHADVKLRTNNHVISAHRSLLRARSPVFYAMFDQEMIETKTGIIDMPDVDLEILNKFLEFLYTGTIEEFDYDNALKLLIVADKYQVSSLCDLCSIFLVSELTVENVCEVMCVADMTNNESLKTSAMEYLTNHAAEVMGSTDCKRWMEKNPKLSAEIISDIFANFSIVPKRIGRK